MRMEGVEEEEKGGGGRGGLKEHRRDEGETTCEREEDMGVEGEGGEGR